MKKNQKSEKEFSVEKQMELVKCREECISVVGVLYQGLIDKDNVLISLADSSGRSLEISAADIVNRTVVEKGVEEDIVQLDIKKESIVVVIHFESARKLTQDSSSRGTHRMMGGRPPIWGSIRCTCTGGCICGCRNPGASGTAQSGANIAVIGDEYDWMSLENPGGGGTARPGLL